MRIGIVFHKDPTKPPTGIDLIRLRAIARELTDRDWTVEIIAPIKKTASLETRIPVRPFSYLDNSGRYDLLKTCYHQSIELIGNHQGLVISRIVRVVDEHLPERDGPMRPKLLALQKKIHQRADALILNNQINAERWRSMYGPRPPITLIPNGCPAKLPPKGENPYPDPKPVVMFLGSLAAPRMVHMLNELAERIHPEITVHYIGRNMVPFYGGARSDTPSPLVVQHGQLTESQIWDFIRYANVGLALAPGPHSFDNDLSKILNYLRGGLPVLAEERILNNDMILQAGYGKIFAYGDRRDMVEKLYALLDDPLTEKKEAVVEFMVRGHSWSKRGQVYDKLASSLFQTGNWKSSLPAMK